MARIEQIRGMLLEEAVLFLLRRSGYTTVDECGDDKTLSACAAGLEVRGRGCRHQIDAISDFRVPQAFGHPQRLLGEAKFLTSKVGIDVIRNALGVLRDASEFWVTGDGREIPRSRFHYRYVVFSVSGFSDRAQRFAFAQDITLVTFENAGYFSEVIAAIRGFNDADWGPEGNGNSPRWLRRLRMSARRVMRGEPLDVRGLDLTEPGVNHLRGLGAACRRLDFVLVAMLGATFPIFLVPSPAMRAVDQIQAQYQVQIFFDENGWYLRNSETNERLFSFDRPQKLIEMYASAGLLSQARAIELKGDWFRAFDAILSLDDGLRIVSFRADEGWLDQILERVRAREPDPDDEEQS